MITHIKRGAIFEDSPDDRPEVLPGEVLSFAFQLFLKS